MSQSLVDAALTPESWKLWTRKLPPHLRLQLPTKPGNDPALNRALARDVLRARRKWIADGKPATDVTLQSAAGAAETWFRDRLEPLTAETLPPLIRDDHNFDRG